LAYPTNGLDELVMGADAIVVATVGEVTAVGTAMVMPLRTPNAEPASTPPESYDVTYYNITVTEVLVSDGSIVENDVLRLMHRPYLFDMGERGASYLYFLATRQPPDGLYGVPYGPHGRLSIDGNEVRFTDEREDVAPFAQGITPTEFLSQLAQLPSK
jgi:hypothetical protein